jgi:hypothetical protein
MSIKTRVDRLETRTQDSEWRIVSICPSCEKTICGRGLPSEACSEHEIAEPTRPGERVIIIEWRVEPIQG